MNEKMIWVHALKDDTYLNKYIWLQYVDFYQLYNPFNMEANEGIIDI